MNWTSERIDQLKQLWAEGVTAEEIARQLECSRNSVMGKVHRLELVERGGAAPQRREWPQDTIDQLKRLWKQKVPVRNIAAQLGVTESSIRHKARRLSLAPPTTPVKHANPSRAFTRIKEGLDETLAIVRGEMKPANVYSPPLSPVDNTQIGVLLLDLTDKACRWPITYCDEQHVFCGRDAPDGQPYCRAHGRMAYAPFRGRAA
jgi:GcrA cell cycle regulator